MNEDLVGERMMRSLDKIAKDERQRVWDAMRVAAADRYAAGQMPAWFDPSWIYQEEAPINAVARQQRPSSAEEQEEMMTGGGGDGLGGPGGPRVRFSGDDGWWREDDPYWMMRDYGDHPMRWWTLGFAAFLAAGGLVTSLATGYTESMQLGWGAAALLVIAGAAMSDAASVPGALGVKLAFAVCALVCAKEALWGWQHKRRRTLEASAPRLGLTGLAALAMCAGYLLTDMSDLGEVSLPTNPGAVFKSTDVAYRSSIWQKWGYGQVTMRV